MSFLFPKPDIKTPKVNLDAPDAPEETAKKVRRPPGLAQKQAIAQQKGITQLGLPVSGLTIPDF